MAGADLNPFEYVRPLAPGTVQGREELIDHLVAGVRGRRLVALVGPRRYGKTSLLGQVAHIAGDVDAIDVVTVDCYGVASIGEFAVRLERAMGGLTGKARQLARQLFDASELGVSLAPGIGFKVTFGKVDAPDATAVLHELLGTLTILSERRSGLLLVLDEFQDAGRVEGLDSLLRSHLQAARGIAVLFAGSRPSLLRRLFSDRARPFYAQAELVEVGRLDPTDAAAAVEVGFESTGRDAGDAGELLARMTEGHPQRLMLCAHLLWESMPPGGSPSTEDVAAALEAAATHTAHEHRAVFDGIDRTHRDTLRSIAGFGSPYARAAQRTLGLGPGTAQSAVRALEADGLIEDRGDGRWRIVDPLLARWIRNELPPPGL